MQELYSLENAKKFNWSSISGDLNAERVAHLENYIVGKKILDAGCGGGAFVEFLCQKGLEVTGIDKYEEFLQVARQQGRLGTYIQGDITHLPFPDKAFDCTYCFDVLEHVDDELAIQELARVTKSRLILAVPKEDNCMNRFGLTFSHYQDKTHLRNYTEESLKKLSSKVHNSSIIVFNELCIPTKHIVQEMTHLTSSTTILEKLSSKVYRKLFNFILEKAKFEDVPTGLVSIIDL